MPSITVLGASNNREKFSNKCVRAYSKLGWTVFPVNPKEKKVEEIERYHSITNVPEKPDRITVYLRPETTIGLIPDFKKAGLKEIILNPGAESDSLLKLLRKNGVKPLLMCSIREIGMTPSDF